MEGGVDLQLVTLGLNDFYMEVCEIPRQSMGFRGANFALLAL